MVSLYVRALTLIALSAALTACAPPSSTDGASSTATIENPVTEMYKPVPLLWEGAAKDGMFWSALSYQIIGAEAAPALLPGASDIEDFCPGYKRLREAQKVNFWAYLISAIAKYESGFNAQARVRSGELDAVTGQPSYGEGLLRLSYGDARQYVFCSFDWAADRNMSLGDRAKSIFDPVRNLDCGIKILATQVENAKRLATAASRWASLKPGGLHLQDVKTLTRAIPFCAAVP